jgi:hypothetical protein
VEIRFESARGSRTLYYFSVDLSNTGAGKEAFLQFCGRLSDGAVLLKGASYLMHERNFSAVRDYVLGHSPVLVQDDSGVPLRYFERDDWRLTPFGTYRNPVAPFASYYQPDLSNLFNTADVRPIEFGFGYHWRADEANLLLAVRRARR